MGKTIDLSRVALRQLQAEIERRRRKQRRQVKSLLPRVQLPALPTYKFIAGENLKANVLVVWNEQTYECFAANKRRSNIIPGIQRICGYTVKDVAKGKRMKLRHWFTNKLLG